MDIIRIDATNSSVLEHVDVDVFDHEVVPRFLVPYLERNGNGMFVALDAGIVIGQIRGIVHMQPDCASQLFVENLGITPARKRLGIATLLMEALIKWGQTQGCEEFWLATEVDNDEAVGFYDALSLLKTNVVMFANFVDD